MFCARCGKPLHDAAKFCSECGAPIALDSNTAAPLPDQTAPQPATVSAVSPHLSQSGPPGVTAKGRALGVGIFVVVAAALGISWYLDNSRSTAPIPVTRTLEDTPKDESVARATMSPGALIGTWRCSIVLLDARVMGGVLYSPGNFTIQFNYQGQPIILGGTYSAAPAGPNSLRVTYEPSNWRPQRICTGPGGVGGNCLDVNFPPWSDQLTFAGPDTYRTQLAACQRVR